MRRKRLGEVLHERGKISAGDLEKALEEQQQKLSHLGELLLERGLVGKPDLIAALEEVSLIPYVDIATTPVDPATLQIIPREIAERLCVLPIRRDLSRLVVVMSDPRNPTVIKELAEIAGMRSLFAAFLRSG
jgi:type IV pilus assembly protein PilB